MQRKNRNLTGFWAFGLGSLSILGTFLIIQINPYKMSLILLALLVAVIAVGLTTNFWGGLIASAVSVFIIIQLSQNIVLNPRTTLFINFASELVAFLFIGPVAGGLVKANKRMIRQADFWKARAEEISVHDQTFGILKPEWAKVRLEEEIFRARRFSRPLSLLLLQGVPKFEMTNGMVSERKDEQVAVLKAMIRLVKSATQPPSILAHAGENQILLILPEFTLQQVEQIVATICKRTEKEIFIPDKWKKSLRIPINQCVELQFGLASLDGEKVTGAEFLGKAKSALERNNLV